MYICFVKLSIINYISVRVVMKNYSVKWDDFHKNMHLYFKHEKDFFDIIFACDDNQQIEDNSFFWKSVL